MLQKIQNMYAVSIFMLTVYIHMYVLIFNKVIRDGKYPPHASA